MKGSISLIAVAHAAVALASLAAVYGVSSAVDGLARHGGGIGDLSAGIAGATRWPTIAAWVAVVASLAALAMMRRREAPEEGSMRTATLAAIAIGAGIAPVLIFRSTSMFIAYGILPPGEAVGEVIRTLTWAGAVTALCFAAALAVAVKAFRSRAAMPVALLAVVLSLGVSATMIVTLRDVNARFGAVANGALLR